MNDEFILIDSTSKNYTVVLSQRHAASLDSALPFAFGQISLSLLLFSISFFVPGFELAYVPFNGSVTLRFLFLLFCCFPSPFVYFSYPLGLLCADRRRHSTFPAIPNLNPLRTTRQSHLNVHLIRVIPSSLPG